MAEHACIDCGNTFYRDPSETWKRRCFPCWKASRYGNSHNAGLAAELATWRQRALTAESSLVELKARAAALDLETLRRIRMLVHPDKHGGSAMANEITQTLNDWIGRSA